MIDPLLLDVPEEFHAERLTLRVPRAGEGAAHNRVLLATLDTLAPWMDWALTAPTEEQSETWCRRMHARFHAREDFSYRVLLRGTETIVGSSGLHRVDWSIPKMEIGYWIARGYEGQGYATEVTIALAQLAFTRMQARRVEIRVDTRNRASQRVAEKAGFTFDCVLRNSHRGAKNVLCDMHLYSRVSEDRS